MDACAPPSYTREMRTTDNTLSNFVASSYTNGHVMFEEAVYKQEWELFMAQTVAKK